ncbi:MAG: fumarylacetoacetate hydrolase family protein [Anaerolineae bacterium]
MIALLRFWNPERGIRTGVRLGDAVHDVTSVVPTLAGWLQASAGRVGDAIAELEAAALRSAETLHFESLLNAPDRRVSHLLAPVDTQEVWAAGVTYERSRVARQEEAADGGDIYARVYVAERPELFFKAPGHRVVGPHAAVGIRRDSKWNVPEPELVLVVNPELEVVGVSAGNDMSSRDIEGANPLYLPQAKVYTASCAIGPQWVLGEYHAWPETNIAISVDRGGEVMVDDRVSTARIHRTLAELVEYLGRCLTFPDGALLMTGTGIVPPSDFTLHAGDVVHIEIDGIGELVNPVEVI